jgi:hypothetical protein
VPETSVVPRTTNGNKADKGLTTQISELWELIVTYLKQETIEPIKGLGRFVAYGVAGSIALALGLFLLLLATLRMLQTETGTSLQGNWSWVPYVATFLVAVAAAALAGIQINRRRNGKG